jgi:serine/threonine-protein kinase HipA
MRPAHKYKKASDMNMAAVIGAESGEADIAEFVRRLTFNTLIGTREGHDRLDDYLVHIGGAS